MNRFVTEAEVEETKKKRAEEWENARAAGRELRKFVHRKLLILYFRVTNEHNISRT